MADSPRLPRRSPLDAWLAARCGLPRLDSPQDAEALAAWQARALQRTLAYAEARSAHYRRAWAGLPGGLLRDVRAGRWPREASTLAEDMALLPGAEPGDLAGEGWRAFLCVSQDEVARMVTLGTSGTTGRAKRLAFAVEDLARTVEFFRVGMTVLTRPDDVVLVLLPGAERPGGVADLLLRALHGQNGAARAVAGDPAATATSFAADRAACRPTCLVAAPRQLERLIALDSPPGVPPFRTLLSSSEPLTPDLRQRVEHAWNCEVFDHYGLTESGYGGGVECAAHSGCHLREADLWLEILDPASGLPARPGEPGEIALTTLDRRAMPLVRYRTGDAAAFLPGPCPCGSPLRRLGPVRGRLVRAEGGAYSPYSLAQPAKGDTRP